MKNKFFILCFSLVGLACSYAFGLSDEKAEDNNNSFWRVVSSNDRLVDALEFEWDSNPDNLGLLFVVEDRPVRWWEFWRRRSE